MKTSRRFRNFMHLLSMVLPFALPGLVLTVWLTGRCGGQDAEPLHIMASMDPDGGRTTTFSTIIPDGNDAQWSCSDGTFLESGTSHVTGRTVTWQPDPDLTDSVMVIITTPSVTDTVRFLPVIPETMPAVTVSAAYHLALLERSRSVQLAPGAYMALANGEGLSNYDGLVILVVQTSGSPRRAFGILPGDSLPIVLPIGGTITAVGLDDVEGALDNSGTVHVTFHLIDPPQGTEEFPAEVMDPVVDSVHTNPGSASVAGNVAPVESAPLEIRPWPLLSTDYPKGPSIVASLPGYSAISSVGASLPVTPVEPDLRATVLLLSGEVPDLLPQGTTVHVAGRSPGSSTENAPPGIYFVAGNPAAWRAASAISSAGYGQLRPVLTLITVREGSEESFSSWLAGLDPETAASTAVVVESQVSVARGAPWIREYALYVAGVDSLTGLPGGFRGADIPGMPELSGEDTYSVAVIP